MSTTKVYIIRHCESTGNVSNRFMGHTDIDITEKGQEQLDHLSERFKDVHIDVVYASPLKRAVLTAEAVIKHHPNVSVTVDRSLIEIDFGDFENIRFPEIVEMDPVNADNWSAAPHLFQSLNGESMQDIYDRAFPAIQKIAEENMGKTIIAATHGCFVRNAICRALGKPLEKITEINWSNNTGVTLMEFDDQLNCSITFMNDLSHIPPQLLEQMKFLPKALRAEIE